jgi:hypothetical protein
MRRSFPLLVVVVGLLCPVRRARHDWVAAGVTR